ncbi:hypothetical protein SEA_CARON_34 [Microbacterium phage Caron]|uniref:Uncharacterized protein n=1 Tax=Microbacterium phage Caron TaxID=3028494 RepID=A0AAE9ZLI2_9CAUD|nr:hypothetical protein SEA_CARON_34 [Microbacterium phage Caron]
MSARAVTATNRLTGVKFTGVQDTDTSIVYLVAPAIQIAADVNAGDDRLGNYVPMFGQHFYDIEELQ